MNLTKSRIILLRNNSFRYLSSEEKPPGIKAEPCKKESLAEAQSYEKWLKNVNSYKKDALFKLDTYKDALSNWRKGHASTEEWYSERVSFWMKRYENFVGLTEVKAAQALVVKEEKLFIDAQQRRRDTQNTINEVQTQLKTLRSDLERTARGDDRYLELITAEHNIIKEENSLVNQLQNLERLEREKFSRLSNAVRDSHEKERAQAEKTKYWSVLGSVIGTCLGVFGTTVNNRYRMKELRTIVSDATKINAAGQDSDPDAVKASNSAGSTMLIPALEDHQKTLESMSKNFLQIMENIDTKIEELNQNVANQKPPVINIPENPVIDLSKEFQALQDLIRKHNKNFVDSQSKILNLRDEKLTQDLKNINAESYNSFSSRVYDIEEMVKDVRSLVLDQVMSSSSSLITSSVKNHEAAKLAERNNQTILGTVESIMTQHEEKVAKQIVTTGIIVVVLVPIVSYAVSKLL